VLIRSESIVEVLTLSSKIRDDMFDYFVHLIIIPAMLRVPRSVLTQNLYSCFFDRLTSYSVVGLLNT